jgi:hypothetical protein
VKAEEEFVDEDQNMSQVGIHFTGDGYDSTGEASPRGRTSKRVLYATMLQDDEEYGTDYNIQQLQ